MAAGETNFILEYWEVLLAREDKIRIPERPCNVLSVYYIDTDEMS